MQPGDRVAYTGAFGAYAQFQSVAANALVRIPDTIDFRLAAGAMLQGMTAHYLTRNSYAISAGDIVLVHAAAGGVGSLLVQMAKRLGATVIATAARTRKPRSRAPKAPTTRSCTRRTNSKRRPSASPGGAA